MATSTTTYTIGPQSLRNVWRSLSDKDALAWAKAIGEALHRMDITGEYACAHFVAQCAHESLEGRWLRELWGPTAAQAGYWKRRDLQGPGPLYPGLGYTTRGAGLVQVTGRSNFKSAAARLGMSYSRLLVVAGTRRYAALLAAVWWKEHMPADMSGWTVEAVTRRVNGGVNGLASREEYTIRALPYRRYLTPRPVAK